MASAIGTSGTHARVHDRYTANSASATASSPASAVSARRSGSLIAWLASAASTGSPATVARTPSGGRSRARMSSITSRWPSSDCSRSPKASTAVLRSGVIAACEKYGGTASSSARTCSRVADSSGVRNRSGSDSAGHSAALPQPSSAE